MRQVTSPACSTARRGRATTALAAGALSIVLLLGVAPSAPADTLTDRQAQLAGQLDQKRQEIHEHTGELAEATAALEASQQRLADARAALEATRAELAGARALDAQLAADLDRERTALRRAKAATAQARTRVREQQRRISEAAREAYQKQSNLTGIAVVLGGRNPAEIGQRLQWDTTIFGSTTARLTKLQALEAQLEDPERAQAAIESRVAADKKASADNVARVARL